VSLLHVCIVSGNCGGFAGLWGVSRNPGIYRCAASWAGVTAWDSQLGYDRDYLGSRRIRRLRSLLKPQDGLDLDSV
jgi:dipeptidyl aminopeptidase/acylaminoacyl peptidase